MRTFKISTLGCKVNQYESQSIRELFKKNKFKEVGANKQADICLINTCTVTSTADRKSKEIIRRLIRTNPKAKIIVTGCLVKLDLDKLSEIKGIDYIIPKSFFPEGAAGFSGHTRAFVKIQDGCDNFCSYCKVPLVRGRSRSRPFFEVIKEAECLASEGYKEIVLTGICIGSYGKDLKPRRNLVDLISSMEKINGLLRIRISSIEVSDVTDRLIKKLRGSKKLCHHLHIPIQSGDDLILKKMNRRYRNKDYLRLISKLKRFIPDIAITTDCLVGFPGETREQFMNTVELVKKIVPLKAHIFPYSARKGTGAHGMNNFLPKKVIKERAEFLRKIAATCSIQYRRVFLKKKASVIFEGPAKYLKNVWEGYSGNYIKIQLKSKKNLNNKALSVIITSLSNDAMIAKLPLDRG